MIDKNPSAENPSTATGRLAHSLVNRRLGALVSELIMIVAGILIALAIDGWSDDVKDRHAEQLYLGLLARDVGEIRKQAELQIEFEKQQLALGARARKMLENPGDIPDKSELGQFLGDLSKRRTLSLSSATYDQMVSSGQLQLIRDPALRDRIVRYFASMDLKQRIVEKNNTYLIDALYEPFLMRAGITVRYQADISNATVSRTFQILNEYLGPDTTDPQDAVLSQPASADSWNDIRRNLVFRLIVSASVLDQAESIVKQTDEMAQAIAAEQVHGQGS